MSACTTLYDSIPRRRSERESTSATSSLLPSAIHLEFRRPAPLLFTILRSAIYSQFLRTVGGLAWEKTVVTFCKTRPTANHGIIALASSRKVKGMLLVFLCSLSYPSGLVKIFSPVVWFVRNSILLHIFPPFKCGYGQVNLCSTLSDIR